MTMHCLLLCAKTSHGHQITFSTNSLDIYIYFFQISWSAVPPVGHDKELQISSQQQSNIFKSHVSCTAICIYMDQNGDVLDKKIQIDLL